MKHGKEVVKLKQIVIKFSVAKGAFSFFMFWMFRHKYTHAAIGLHRDGDAFYSFSLKGFSTEKKRTSTPKTWRENYAYYYIDVRESDYDKLVALVEQFQQNQEQYRYSTFEVFCALLKIPYQVKSGYYCSYFVADLLTSSGVYTLKKSPSLYLPHDLYQEIKNHAHIEYTCGSAG